MFRLGQYYHGLKNRPFGAVTIFAFFGTALASCLLAAGLAFPQFAPYAIAICLASGLLLLSLIVALLAKLQAKLNDVLYSISLENGLPRAGQQPDDFFMDEAAGNPSLQLLHFKILRFTRPKMTLELGSGQTTKLLSCHKTANPDAYILTLEQNEQWFRLLGPALCHDYRHVLLEQKQFTCDGTGLRLSTRWYKDIPEFHGPKFNYILVDGPDHGGAGSAHVDYSRCGILQFIPGILADSFVMVFDDAERHGESMTINALEGVFRAKGIKFIRFARHGVKTQVVFCSADLSFLRSV